MSPNAETLARAIRIATLADASRLAELSGQLGYPATTEAIQHRLVSIQQDDEQVVYVLETAGAVQGWIHVAVRHLLETGTQAEIAGLVMDERCRGLGAGRLLVRRAEEWAQSKRCSAVRVRSNVVRERAHAFYQQLGYRIVKTQRVFQKELAGASANSVH